MPRTSLRSSSARTAVPRSSHDDRDGVPERFPIGQYRVPHLFGSFADPARGVLVVMRSGAVVDLVIF